MPEGEAAAANESLGTLRASPEMEIFRKVEEDQTVICRIVSVQREEMEQEITGFQEEAEKVTVEERKLPKDLPF